MQTTNVEYDEDAGVLRIRLDTGDEYQIDNAGHAARIKDKISVGGVISDDQRWWLEKYRINLRQGNRDRLRERLRQLRRELKEV